VLLALRHAPVAADVAVLAAHDHVDGVLVTHIAELAHGGRVDTREAAWPQHVLRSVTELHLHGAAVDEVRLLLLVVEVATALVAGRDGDGVHAERGHPELAPDLAEAVALADRVDVRDGVPVARDHVVDWFVGHRTPIVQPPRHQAVPPRI